MQDRNCYTYLIGWSKLNVWYYGRKTAKGCSPDQFWKTYFTSSKYVKTFREENGEPDVIEIRKTFSDNHKRCCEWEQRVLAYLNVVENIKFLNRAISDGKFDFTNRQFSSESKEKLSKSGRNRIVSEETKEKMSKWQKGSKKPRTSVGIAARKKFIDSLTNEEKKQKFGTHMLNMSKEQRLNLSKKSSKHEYKFISPTKEIYFHHSIIAFAKEHNLHHPSLYSNLNKGKFLKIRYPKQIESLYLRTNTLGWEVTTVH